MARLLKIGPVVIKEMERTLNRDTDYFHSILINDVEFGLTYEAELVRPRKTFQVYCHKFERPDLWDMWKNSSNDAFMIDVFQKYSAWKALKAQEPIWEPPPGATQEYTDAFNAELLDWEHKMAAFGPYENSRLFSYIAQKEQEFNTTLGIIIA